MTELADLQSLFQSHVINGDGAAVASFVGNADASTEERLGVYYDAYRLRLLEILRDDFPGLCGLMSEDAFEALGLRYLDKHPSQYPSVRQFGRHFAEFLVTDRASTEQPWLAEMAQFEWARGLAFDAANADVLTLEDLGALPAEDWPTLRLRFHPSLQRIRLNWNVVPAWHAVNDGASVPQGIRREQSEPWVVWRRDVTVYWRSLSDGESTAIEAFADGGDFSAVCAVLCEQLDAEGVPATMAGLLNQWITEGLVAK